MARGGDRHATRLNTRRGRAGHHSSRYVKHVPYTAVDFSLSPLPTDALKNAMSKMTALVPTLTSQIVLILARRGCDALLPMRSIPSQFRASAKKTPTEPSYFISLIFKHTKAFFGIQTVDGPGSALKDSLLASVAEEVFEVVAQRYIYFLSAMKKTEESLRRLKKGKKATYSLFGGNKADDDGKADEDKIRTQMILDVEAFGREAQSLGVAVQENVTYRSLVEMACSSMTDGESTTVPCPPNDNPS